MEYNARYWWKLSRCHFTEINVRAAFTHAAVIHYKDVSNILQEKSFCFISKIQNLHCISDEYSLLIYKAELSVH